jgi:hypothetical protein
VLLARLVDRLSERLQFVTFEEIEKAAARPSSRLATDGLAALVEGAVADSLLLKDLRTFYDRRTGTFTEQWVYRVNVRHPLVAPIE